MDIKVLCVGKLKESYWTEAMSEYSKRLGKYCSLGIIEVKEEKAGDNPSNAEELAIVGAEGRRLGNMSKEGSYRIALDIKGKALSSEELAVKMEDLRLQGRSSVEFFIGGSLGLSSEVLEGADLRLSFSKLTFPHQMMRVILLEQIYRSFRIARNEPYHK